MTGTKSPIDVEQTFPICHAQHPVNQSASSQLLIALWAEIEAALEARSAA
jgi:hypothetical protein